MEEQPPAPKKKRKVVPKPKDQEEFVVKASLNGSLKGNPEEKESLIRLFRGWSDALSERLAFASRGLTLILKECFHKSNDFKNAPLPQFLEQTFIRQLLLGLEKSRTDNPYIRDLFERYPLFLRNTPRYQGDRNLYSSATNAYLVNLKVSLSFIFEKRLLRLAFSSKNTLNWKEKECIKVIKHRILGDFLPKDIEEMNLEARYPSLATFINEVRDFLDFKDGETVTDYWLKTNPYKVVRFYAYILSKLTKDDKPFNLLPLTTVRNHFATLDRSCLLGLFKEAKLLGKNTKEEQLTSDYLESVFKVHKNIKAPKQLYLTGTIQTDGTSICFHFRRPKIKLSAEQVAKRIEQTKKLFKDKDVVKLSNDPGRENIYTVVKEDEKKKSWKLSRKEYYTVSGIFKARRKTKSWSKSIKSNLDAFSKVTPKGISLETYLRYLKVFFVNFDPIWKEYSKKKWAAQRLRLYGGKKRCFANFWNKVLGKEDERTKKMVMAYGGGKFASGGKGEMSVPTSQAFKECKKQKSLEIMVTDEFRSSKVHNETHQLLHLVKVKGAEHPLRGLLWCCSTISEKQGFFVNRDVNAAWNILKNALERPEIFQRSKDSRRLPKQQIKIYIQPAKGTKTLGDGWSSKPKFLRIKKQQLLRN
jgi:hypothetical protein